MPISTDTANSIRQVEKMIKGIRIMTMLGSAVPGITAGAGIGFISKGVLEDKFKDKKDRDAKDNAIHYSPLIGTLTGTAIGTMIGARAAKKQLAPAIEMLQMLKASALNEDVQLNEYQNNAIDMLKKNKGRGIIAHATGSGKTLTSIAGFEKLRLNGEAKKALVIVPASLRENYIDNLKKFTNSTYDIYGPLSEKTSLNIDQPSDKDYSIISYEMFKKDPEGVIKQSGADTLIIDEIHRAKSTDSDTYRKLKDVSPLVKNVFTLTGSMVSNAPSDIIPLMDITYTEKGNPIGTKKMFDKLFVNKQVKSKGYLSPKSIMTENLKNQNQLRKYLVGKVNYLSHADIAENLPPVIDETIKVEMTPEQKKLYMYSLSSVDPITRWKIKHNVPVGQHEASGIFGRLMQSRQIMGDPAIMDVTLQGKDPYEYSPKIRRAVDDLQKYLDEDETHKSVIYGNLVKSQIDAISKSLDKRDIPYSKFIGIGNDGSSVKQRIESLDKFRKGKNRVLLISGAGGEGLDLQGVGMMQLLEGHYNPEKIQQAEARVRRYQRTPSGDNMEPIMIKKYVSTIPTTGINKLMPKFLKSTPASVDEWIYTVAKRKDDLNEQFRNVVKTASIADSMTMTKDVPGIDEIVSNAAAEVAMNMQLGMVGQIGSAWGGAIANFLKPRQKQMTETAVRQRILDTEHPEFLQKKHVSRIMAKSLVDERRLETDIGTSLLGGATGIMAGNLARAVVKPASKVGKMAPWVAGLTVGMATQPAINHFINKALAVRIMRTDDVKKGVDKYVEELEKKMHRKYKASQEFINEYDKRKELGVDVYSI